MGFKFKVEGSFCAVVTQLTEIERQAREEGILVSIWKDTLLGEKPYIIVSCDDEQKGKRLFDKVKNEAPRFSSI